MLAALSPAQNLFAYGSLMCADIMAEVVGAQLRSTPAVLRGYRRFLVRDEHYPGVMADAGGMVTGLVYHGVTGEGWARLDRFEGAMYDRKTVPVRLVDETHIMADCYIFRSAFTHLLTRTEWDYVVFLRSGKTQFQQQYGGFKAID